MRLGMPQTTFLVWFPQGTATMECALRAKLASHDLSLLHCSNLPKELQTSLHMHQDFPAPLLRHVQCHVYFLWESQPSPGPHEGIPALQAHRQLQRWKVFAQLCAPFHGKLLGALLTEAVHSPAQGTTHQGFKVSFLPEARVLLFAQTAPQDLYVHSVLEQALCQTVSSLAQVQTTLCHLLESKARAPSNPDPKEKTLQTKPGESAG